MNRAQVLKAVIHEPAPYTVLFLVAGELGANFRTVSKVFKKIWASFENWICVKMGFFSSDFHVFLGKFFAQFFGFGLE